MNRESVSREDSVAIVRVRGFHIYRDRTGKMRCYRRARGQPRTPVDLEKFPLGTPEFFAECARIANMERLTGASRPGSLGHLIREYKQSDAFTDLGDRTKADYLRIFDYLQPLRRQPLDSFTRPVIVRMRDKAGKDHGRRFGTYVKQVLSIIFSWGAERGFLPENPAKGIKGLKRPRGEQTANRPWTDEERFNVLEGLPWQLRIPVALMMYTGMRTGDALRLPRSAVEGEVITTITRKTGQRVTWPMPAGLRQILSQAWAEQREHDARRAARLAKKGLAVPPAAMTLCVTTAGTPWDEAGFRASWRKHRVHLEKAGKVAPGLTMHGLRHTMAKILAEEGFDNRTIADALGQATEGMARHYSRDAETGRKMKGVVRVLNRSETRRRTAAEKRRKD